MAHEDSVIVVVLVISDLLVLEHYERTSSNSGGKSIHLGFPADLGCQVQAQDVLIRRVPAVRYGCNAMREGLFIMPEDRKHLDHTPRVDCPLIIKRNVDTGD